MTSEIDALVALSREIKLYPHTIIHNEKGKKRLQSAVAFIFRVAPSFKNKLDDKFLAELPDKYYFQASASDLKKIFKPVKESHQGLLELLFVQRQINEKDLHSVQIAFPGGHVDGEESDFQAVLREVHEEVGIKLMENKNALYLGKLPKNFYCYPKREASLYLNAHVFVLVKYDEKNIKLDLNELKAFKWVRFSNFLEGGEGRLKFKKISQPPRSSNKLMNSNYIKNNFSGAEYGAFDIDMDELLWGLTLLLTTYLCMMIRSYRVRVHHGNSFPFLDKYIPHTRILNISFKPGFVAAVPASAMGKAWFLKNRVHEFSYSDGSRAKLLKKLVFFLVYFLFFLFVLRLVSHFQSL